MIPVTQKDHWILVHGMAYRPLTTRELARGMGFPDGYGWPEELARATVIRGLGNAVVPAVGRALVKAVLDVA